LIVFDASALVSAALKADSVPERALLRAEEVDVFALSAAVDAEIAGVLGPRSSRARFRSRGVSASSIFYEGRLYGSSRRCT
jgi:predicted nucleic acid-binding protein